MSLDLFEQVLEKASAYEVSEPPATMGKDEPTVVVETVEHEARDTQSAPKEKVSSITVVNLFRNPDAHPLVLDLALLRKYGPEWLGWELETLQQRIQKDFNTPTVSDLNLEKVQACKTLHLVDTYWLQWEVFSPCTKALNGVFADFRTLVPPTVGECMIAVDIANRIRQDVPWSEEVETYIGIVHRHDDILLTQPPLDFARIDMPFEVSVDLKKVAVSWPEVRRSGKAPGGSTMEDEQLRRMLSVREALESSRTELHNQLPVVRYV